MSSTRLEVGARLPSESLPMDAAWGVVSATRRVGAGSGSVGLGSTVSSSSEASAAGVEGPGQHDVGSASV